MRYSDLAVVAITTAGLYLGSGLRAEIILNDAVRFDGFVDSSYQYQDSSRDGGKHDLHVDQVEVHAWVDWYPVSALLDLAYLQSDSAVSGKGFGIEQAYLSYEYSETSSITAGRYASMLGYEAYEPTGLYQQSHWSDRFDGAVLRMPGYAHGVKFAYQGDATFVGASLQTTAEDRADSLGSFDSLNQGWGLELAASYWNPHGFTAFVGAAFEDHETKGEHSLLNTYVSFQTGAWTLATELSYGEVDTSAFSDADGLSGLFLVNFAYSPKVSLTSRVSYYTTEIGGGTDHGVTYALAHSYALTQQLILVSELSYTDENQSTSALAKASRGDDETVFGAIELLFTF